MTRRQHRKDKAMRLKMKQDEPMLNYKPEEADPDKEEQKFQEWRQSFLQSLKEEVFSKNEPALCF